MADMIQVLEGVDCSECQRHAPLQGLSAFGPNVVSMLALLGLAYVGFRYLKRRRPARRRG